MEKEITFNCNDASSNLVLTIYDSKYRLKDLISVCLRFKIFAIMSDLCQNICDKADI